MTVTEKKIYRLLAIPEIIVPFLYISLVIILGALEPRYNHLTMMMSMIGIVSSKIFFCHQRKNENNSKQFDLYDE